jgi:hypothetical protein
VAGATPLPKTPYGRLGWPDHPLFGQGVASKPPQALGGGPATPNGTNPFRFFFFFLGGFRGGRTTPKGLGVASATPDRPYGVAEATPWPKRGGPATPFLGKKPPPIALFFFFFFLKKKKKKKKKQEMGQNYAVLGKTASFWASLKQRSFGVKGSVGIYIYLYTHYTLKGV